MFRSNKLIILMLIVIGLSACDFSSGGKSLSRFFPQQHYIETGDLDALKKRGKLRVLLTKLSADVDYLPRKGLPVHFEVEMITRFAGQLGLEPVWIYVDKFEQLSPMLIQGMGDVIAANFTVTEQRKAQMTFSVPVVNVTEKIVVRANDSIKTPKDLKGRTIHIAKSSSYWQTAQQLSQSQDGINVNAVPETMTVEEVIDAVASGSFDVTIADSNLVNAILPFQSKLASPFDVSGQRAIAWAIRKDAEQLLEALNKFLTNEQLTKRRQEIYKVDFPEIKDKKVLRVLTRNNAANYFLWRGELLGFEYELAKEFAKRHGLRLEMIVAPNRKELIKWLREGKGDLVAASLTIRDEYARQGMVFSQPYNHVSEIVVARVDDVEKLNTIDDLVGRSVHVRPSSSYWHTLTKYLNSGARFKLETVPENLETEEIIEKVAANEFDLTIADSHILDIEMTWRNDIAGAFSLGTTVSHGWLVRNDSPELLDAIDKFIADEYRGLFYNITHKKYFQQERSIRKHLEHRIDSDAKGQLSPYDEMVKSIAEEYAFDWRLVVSQMYQESRFEPEAKSWAGALGLMQVMPRTAHELGIDDLKDPQSSIVAGIRYLDWLRDRFEPELSVKDRMWFTLASYNAGVGHVRDARRLAKQKGWNENRWFGHVERAMLLLAKRKYAKQARHGYVRGSEPVRYVREISTRYNAYLKLAKS